jgi:uncharacterized protein (TIGR00369 family)
LSDIEPDVSHGDVDRFSTAPISRLVGFKVEPSPHASDSGIGEATVRLECVTHHHNPMGRVHGGLIAALADAAMGIAFGRTLLAGEDFSTIDMNVSFIRPVREGWISAHASVIERGLRIGFVKCEITNARGKRIATATCTCTVIRDV